LDAPRVDVQRAASDILARRIATKSQRREPISSIAFRVDRRQFGRPRPCSFSSVMNFCRSPGGVNPSGGTSLNADSDERSSFEPRRCEPFDRWRLWPCCTPSAPGSLESPRAADHDDVSRHAGATSFSAPFASGQVERFPHTTSIVFCEFILNPIRHQVTVAVAALLTTTYRFPFIRSVPRRPTLDRRPVGHVPQRSHAATPLLGDKSASPLSASTQCER